MPVTIIFLSNNIIKYDDKMKYTSMKENTCCMCRVFTDDSVHLHYLHCLVSTAERSR